MNPAKSYAHLFSPLGGEAGDNYRAPNVLTFLRSPHVALNAQALKKSGARYAFLGVPFDEGNIGKPGSEEGPREFRLASQEYFTYWFEYNIDLYGTAVDCGDVSMPKVKSGRRARQNLSRGARSAKSRPRANSCRWRSFTIDRGDESAFRSYRGQEKDGLSAFWRSSRSRR